MLNGKQARTLSNCSFQFDLKTYVKIPRSLLHHFCTVCSDNCLSECLESIWYFLFQILKKYGTEFVKHIEDITDFVHEQKKILDEKGQEHVNVAKETVYPITNHDIAAKIGLDFHEPAQLVGFVS